MEDSFETRAIANGLSQMSVEKKGARKSINQSRGHQNGQEAVYQT